ncbi:MAG: hypothetical protein MR904_01190 [Clostridia bacterium]|nr:hypothetical protein [Clostridia bacterium]
MREISEYKLLGYYLLKLYEKTGVDNLKYEQVKYLSDAVLKKVNSTNSVLIPLATKSNIVKTMISKGVFKTTSINGKSSFTQIYNYEIAKYIYVTYNCDGNLTFRLPKDIKTNNKNSLSQIKNIYTNLNLDIISIANNELNTYFAKAYPKKGL